MSAGFGATANRLGALALRLSDRMQMAVTADGVRSLSAATALSVLDRWFGAPPSVDALRRVLGLTPSGGVRLVDVLKRLAKPRELGMGIPDGYPNFVLAGCPAAGCAPA